MRTLIDIDEKQVRDLDEIASAAGRSRAALIREAVQAFLARNRGAAANDAFGLWGERKIDGLAYQKKLRAEW